MILLGLLDWRQLSLVPLEAPHSVRASPSCVVDVEVLLAGDFRVCACVGGIVMIVASPIQPFSLFLLSECSTCWSSSSDMRPPDSQYRLLGPASLCRWSVVVVIDGSTGAAPIADY